MLAFSHLFLAFLLNITASDRCGLWHQLTTAAVVNAAIAREISPMCRSIPNITTTEFLWGASSRHHLFTAAGCATVRMLARRVSLLGYPIGNPDDDAEQRADNSDRDPR